MSKSLFEQYLEAKEAREAEQKKRLEAWKAEQKEERFDGLCEIIENEDLDLMPTNCQYVICTKEGDPVSDYFDSLDEVEAWLEDPGFIFSEKNQEQKQDDPPFDLDGPEEDDLIVAEAWAIVDRLSEIKPETRRSFLNMLNRIDWENIKRNSEVITDPVEGAKNK